MCRAARGSRPALPRTDSLTDCKAGTVRGGRPGLRAGYRPRSAPSARRARRRRRRPPPLPALSCGSPVADFTVTVDQAPPPDLDAALVGLSRDGPALLAARRWVAASEFLPACLRLFAMGGASLRGSQFRCGCAALAWRLSLRAYCKRCPLPHPAPCGRGSGPGAPVRRGPPAPGPGPPPALTFSQSSSLSHRPRRLLVGRRLRVRRRVGRGPGGPSHAAAGAGRDSERGPIRLGGPVLRTGRVRVCGPGGPTPPEPLKRQLTPEQTRCPTPRRYPS